MTPLHPVLIELQEAAVNYAFWTAEQRAHVLLHPNTDILEAKGLNAARNRLNAIINKINDLLTKTPSAEEVAQRQAKMERIGGLAREIPTSNAFRSQELASAILQEIQS